jgi:nickel-dependent lactate racemase
MLALNFEVGGRRVGVGPGLLNGNPVHIECDLFAEKVSPAFGINTIVDEIGRPISIYAGQWREAHRLACEDYLESHSLPIAEKRSVVIASCGGSPYDTNMIQAHKTLEMASYACEEGGTIILLAECSEGLGRPDFLKWFEEATSRALESRLREFYEVNGQTAWSLLTKTERFKVVTISRLPQEEIIKMRMIPAASLKDALANVDRAADGYILPRGNAFLPVLQASNEGNIARQLQQL